jgi:hypothetical protein
MEATLNSKQALVRSVLLAASAICAPAFAGDGSDGPVVVKTQDLPPHVAKGVEDAAAQGQDSLRRYVERTRRIYQLDLTAIVATPEEAAAMKAGAAAREAKHAKDGPPKGSPL